jgi:integrase
MAPEKPNAQQSAYARNKTKRNYQVFIKSFWQVCPLNLRKLLEADRTAAGLRKWPSNALRHGFASYNLAKFNDQVKLALELRHTDQEVIFRYYRELVKPEQAPKYRNIRLPAQTTLVALSS